MRGPCEGATCGEAGRRELLTVEEESSRCWGRGIQRADNTCTGGLKREAGGADRKREQDRAM